MKRRINMFMFLLGAAMIGGGVGTLLKGYNDRLKHTPALESIAMKVLEDRVYTYDKEGKAKVEILVTPKEVEDLMFYELYTRRLQTKLSSVNPLILGVTILAGVILMMFSGRKGISKSN